MLRRHVRAAFHPTHCSSIPSSSSPQPSCSRQQRGEADLHLQQLPSLLHPARLLAAASNAVGRTSTSNNVILDTTQDEGKWRELDMQVRVGVGDVGGWVGDG